MASSAAPLRPSRASGPARPATSPASLTTNTVCAALLEAKLAAASGAAGAAAALDRLDTLMRSGPGGQRNGPPVAFTLSPAYVRSTVGISPFGFEDFANLEVARLRERQGNISGGAGRRPAAAVLLPPHRLPGVAPARGGPAGRAQRRHVGGDPGLPALPGSCGRIRSRLSGRWSRQCKRSWRS